MIKNYNIIVINTITPMEYIPFMGISWCIGKTLSLVFLKEHTLTELYVVHLIPWVSAIDMLPCLQSHLT